MGKEQVKNMKQFNHAVILELKCSLKFINLHAFDCSSKTENKADGGALT